MTDPLQDVELPPLTKIAYAELKPDGKMRSISWTPPSAESLEIAGIEGTAWHALVTEESARQAVLAERERVRPKSIEERMAELKPRPCDQCSGTLRADTNLYNVFYRCDQCSAVPLPSPFAAAIRSHGVSDPAYKQEQAEKNANLRKLLDELPGAYLK